MLYLTINPNSQEGNKGDPKGNQEDRLHAEEITSLNYFNSTIVEGALVWSLIYFIENGAHKIKCSRLQQKESMLKSHAKDVLQYFTGIKMLVEGARTPRGACSIDKSMH